MRFSCGLLGWVALVAGLVLGACQAQSETEVLPSDGGGVSGVDASIAFEHEGTLTLAPAAETEVRVVGSPPAPYGIAFYLVGEALDATLDRTSVVADPAGRAAVTLRAPGHATIFALRATIKDGPSAELQVSVSEEGFGTLLVAPTYGGGRQTRSWRASVVSGATCQALASSFPTDPPGALTATADPEDELVIEGAPVGPSLAVFVRGGHYMWGCADEADLQAGKSKEVEVKIINKPIDMSEANLAVELSFSPEPDPWQQLVSDSTGLLLDASLDLDSSEPEHLLDAMAAAHVSEPAFSDARAANGWDELLEGYWSSQGLALREWLVDLVAAGIAAQPPAIFGRVATVDAADSEGLLVLDAIGDISAQQACASCLFPVTWTVDPDDTVRLGGLIEWLPSRVLGAAAAQAALEQHPEQDDMPAVLAHAVDCAAVGELLAGELDGCDASCRAGLCESGLGALWSASLDASVEASLAGEIALEASGAALFDDVAALTGFEGWWLGEVSNGLLSADVEGVVSAEPSQEPVIE